MSASQPASQESFSLCLCLSLPRPRLLLSSLRAQWSWIVTNGHEAKEFKFTCSRGDVDSSGIKCLHIINFLSCFEGEKPVMNVCTWSYFHTGIIVRHQKVSNIKSWH